MSPSKLSPAPKRTASTTKAPGKAAPLKANRLSVSGVEKTVSIRKIENGYLVCESSYGPRGYKTKETFSPKAPVVQVEPSKRR